MQHDGIANLMRFTARALLVSGVAAMAVVSSAQGQNGRAPAHGVDHQIARNTGNEPEGAFIVDLRHGYDEDTQYLASYVMNTGGNGTAYMPGMIEFNPAGMTLHLRKEKTRGVPYRGAEFHRSGFYGYGRYEVVMRGAKGSGVVSSFFTHTHEQFGDPHDEIDLEFLGKNPRQVELNYFTNGKSWGGKLIPLDFDFTESFQLYAFEWSPNSIRWFVNDRMVHEVRAGESKVPLPKASGRVIANLWAGRGDTQYWTGPATTERSSASYTCMSHVPLGQAGAQCSDRR